MAEAPQMVSLEQATWAWIHAGPKKHHSELGVRFVKGAMAGMMLSLGGTLVQIMTANPWFTTNAPGNMAIMIMATVKRKVPYWAFVIDWTICFLGAGMQADAKVSAINFRQVFLRAIGCNYAVCAAVFLASLAKDVVSKVVISYLPIFFFVAAGYEHVVANMFLIPEGLMTGKANFGTGEYIWKSIIASFLGNIVGAALLVLPLVYIHGRDEFDPQNVNQDMIGTSSPTDTYAGPQKKTEHWKEDVERTAAAQ
ncbi:hypothetical protein L7F22_038946 [Adiantum nelumboides]|nr:hypothetical protein [Adiantum nelumboides]